MHLEMQVRAGGVAGVARVRDLLALGDNIAHRDQQLGIVRIQRLVAVLVVEDDIVPIAVVQIARHDHLAVVRGIDRCALGHSQINAAVQLAPAPFEARGKGVAGHRDGKFPRADAHVLGADLDDLVGRAAQYRALEDSAPVFLTVYGLDLGSNDRLARAALLQGGAVGLVELVVFAGDGLVGDFLCVGDRAGRGHIQTGREVVIQLAEIRDQTGLGDDRVHTHLLQKVRVLIRGRGVLRLDAVEQRLCVLSRAAHAGLLTVYRDDRQRVQLAARLDQIGFQFVRREELGRRCAQRFGRDGDRQGVVAARQRGRALLDRIDRRGERVRIFHKAERRAVRQHQGAALREQRAGDEKQRHEQGERADRAPALRKAERAGNGRPQRQVINPADQPVEQQHGPDQHI